MNKTVILIGMIVIVSLTMPPAFADGVGPSEQPTNPSGDPDTLSDEVIAIIESFGIVGFEGGRPVGAPEPSSEAPEAPPAPDGDVPEGVPDRTPVCPMIMGSGSVCDPSSPPPAPDEEAPDAPQAPETGAQTAPAAPEVAPPRIQAPEAPAAPEPQAPDAGILDALLAPVQAAAKSAADGARGAIAGVLTTAGFVADEATAEVETQAEAAFGFVVGTADMVSTLVSELLWTATLDDGAAFGSNVETQTAEAGHVQGPANYVTLGLIAVGSIGLIAAGFVGLRKLLGLGGIALLSRIPSKDIMKNDTRASIFEIVQSDPGVSLNEIVDRLGLSRNAVAYHLAVFESEKTVVSVKDGKYRRYFVNGGKYVNGAKDVVSTIKNDVTLNVIRYILDHPGVMQKEVCSAVGTSPSATNWHINRLEKVGLVEKAKVANTVRYSPGPSFGKYDLAEFGLAAQTA